MSSRRQRERRERQERQRGRHAASAAPHPSDEMWERGAALGPQQARPRQGGGRRAPPPKRVSGPRALHATRLRHDPHPGVRRQGHVDVRGLPGRQAPPEGRVSPPPLRKSCPAWSSATTSATTSAAQRSSTSAALRARNSSATSAGTSAWRGSASSQPRRRSTPAKKAADEKRRREIPIEYNRIRELLTGDFQPARPRGGRIRRGYGLRPARRTVRGVADPGSGS